MRTPERLEIEALLRSGSARLAKPAPLGRIGDEARERGCEGARVTWRHKDPGFAVDDQLWDAAHARGDDRKPCGHGLEHRDGQALRPAGEDEDVRVREQLRNVVTLADEPNAFLNAERADLPLERRPIRALADDQRLASLGERAHGSDEGQEVLRRLEPAHGDDPRLPALVSSLWSGADVDCVGNDDRSLRVTGTGGDARRPLALRHADRHGRQRRDHAVTPEVEPALESRVRGEGPTVHGEDPDRNPGEARGETAEHSGLRAIRVQDVRPLAAKEAHELHETGQILPRVDPSADMFKRDEGGPQRSRSLTKGAHPVGRDEHVEPGSERRKQGGDVALRSADLRERDQQEDPRPPLGGF